MSVMLYKHPGSHALHGDKFDYIVVDEAQATGKLKGGWFRTTTEAKAKKKKRKPKPKPSYKLEAEEVAA